MKNTNVRVLLGGVSLAVLLSSSLSLPAYAMEEEDYFSQDESVSQSIKPEAEMKERDGNHNPQSFSRQKTTVRRGRKAAPRAWTFEDESEDERTVKAAADALRREEQIRALANAQASLRGEVETAQLDLQRERLSHGLIRHAAASTQMRVNIESQQLERVRGQARDLKTHTRTATKVSDFLANQKLKQLSRRYKAAKDPKSGAELADGDGNYVPQTNALGGFVGHKKDRYRMRRGVLVRLGYLDESDDEVPTSEERLIFAKVQQGRWEKALDDSYNSSNRFEEGPFTVVAQAQKEKYGREVTDLEAEFLQQSLEAEGAQLALFGQPFSSPDVNRQLAPSFSSVSYPPFSFRSLLENSDQAVSFNPLMSSQRRASIQGESVEQTRARYAEELRVADEKCTAKQKAYVLLEDRDFNDPEKVEAGQQLSTALSAFGAARDKSDAWNSAHPGINLELSSHGRVDFGFAANSSFPAGFSLTLSPLHLPPVESFMVYTKPGPEGATPGEVPGAEPTLAHLQIMNLDGTVWSGDIPDPSPDDPLWDGVGQDIESSLAGSVPPPSLDQGHAGQSPAEPTDGDGFFETGDDFHEDSPAAAASGKKATPAVSAGGAGDRLAGSDGDDLNWLFRDDTETPQTDGAAVRRKSRVS